MGREGERKDVEWFVGKCPIMVFFQAWGFFQNRCAV